MQLHWAECVCDADAGGIFVMNMSIRTSDIRWLAPVYIRIGYGIPEAIRSPKQALDYLLYRWPDCRAEAYEQAKTACMVAMTQMLPCDGVREDFIRACIEARILD
jgi:hypothetical protein